MNQTYREINLQYAVHPSLPIWGDLEGLLDEENGMYYYSARYYDPNGTFISRDPMFEKAPYISPYAYCFNSPIKYIDEDGEWPWEPSNVRNARKWQRQHGGKFEKWTSKSGVMASVTVNIKNTSTSRGKNADGSIELSGVYVGIKLFNPTNDSWGDKLKTLYNKMKLFEDRRSKYKDETNFGGTVLSTKKSDYNQQGPAIATNSTDLMGGDLYTNIDNMLFVSPANPGEGITGLLNTVANAFELGYNFVGGIQDAYSSGHQDNKDGLNPNGKVSVPYYKKTPYGGYGGEQTGVLRKDSAKVSKQLNGE